MKKNRQHCREYPLQKKTWNVEAASGLEIHISVPCLYISMYANFAVPRKQVQKKRVPVKVKTLIFFRLCIPSSCLLVYLVWFMLGLASMLDGVLSKYMLTNKQNLRNSNSLKCDYVYLSMCDDYIIIHIQTDIAQLKLKQLE